jgi:nitrogen fixation protein FixH
MHQLKRQPEEKKIDWKKLKGNIKIVAQEFLTKAKRKCISNVSEKEIQALKELKEGRSIVILRADKGNAIVIMDKQNI